jgi:methionine-rich copper-binding protein CopC
MMMEISGSMTVQRGLRPAIGFSANMPNRPVKSNLRTFRRKGAELTTCKLALLSDAARRLENQLTQRMKPNSFPAQRPLVGVTLLLALTLLLAVPKEALAHARLLKSSPKDGETVKAPAHFDLWFSELLDGGGFNSIVVFSATELKSKTHTNLADGDAKVDAKDRTHLTVNVKTLTAGEYVVDWRVLSLDGHSAPGRFKFKVGEPKADTK